MNTDDMPVLRVSGSPRARGRAVAEELGDTFKDAVRKWFDVTGRARGRNPEQYLREFLAATSHRSICARLSPNLLEEIAGMAEASGFAEDLMFASQLHDEEWLYARYAHLRHADAEGEKCSSIGVNDIEGGPTIIGQNMDIGAWADGFQVVVRHQYDDRDLEVVCFANAGSIGLCGLNSAGVGVCCNTLIQLDHSVSGLPVAFVMRMILEQTSFENVETRLENTPHASGQNYLVGAPGTIGSFECSAKSVALHWPKPGLNRTYHTNHAFANGDRAMSDARCPGRDIAMVSGSPTTAIRYAALERRIGDPTAPIGVDELKAALASKDDPAGPVCREANADGDGADAHMGYTAGSLVMELSGRPVLHIAAGPPSLSQYRAIPIG